MGGKILFRDLLTNTVRSSPFSLCCSCIGTVLKNRTLLSISIKDPSCAIPPYHTYHQFMAQTLGQKRYSAGLAYTRIFFFYIFTFLEVLHEIRASKSFSARNTWYCMNLKEGYLPWKKKECAKL